MRSYWKQAILGTIIVRQNSLYLKTEEACEERRKAATYSTTPKNLDQKNPKADQKVTKESCNA
jgi:hypothetical protein